ncbi:MAG TPA: peptide chain release factor N(5)-glutamine methyltransferase [Natronosporangium sp.]|nr:peptide chain release factor N(5)-glutamine methyltransferase [Natronosporangium sp.]
MTTSLRDQLAAAARRLEAAGVPSPRTDAELLAAHVLGVPRGQLAMAGPLTGSRWRRFTRLVAARCRRVPLQHLTGTAAFGHLELAVGPGVFVPRPETELLAEWAVARDGAVIVDLCSGSGALALEIAHELPRATVYAVERSPAALRWLRRNAAARAAAGDRPVRVVAGDARDPAVLAELDGTVDLVVCNPPYVPAATAVAPEVRSDPPEAVFGGADGLAVIVPVIDRAARLLRPGGWFGVEHDDSHGRAVPELLRRDGRFHRVSDHRDLAGRPRYATAQRAG